MIEINNVAPQPVDMLDHPEGGRFKRIFCSEVKIKHKKKGSRPALSHIYFEIGKGQVSHMHCVDNDESWNLYRGEGVFLYLWDGNKSRAVRIELSAKSNSYCYVVPAGIWQCAEPIGESVLVGCSVAPAFEFDDFTLLRDEKGLCSDFKIFNSDLERFI